MLVADAWDRINNDRRSRYFMMLFDGGVCLQDRLDCSAYHCVDG